MVHFSLPKKAHFNLPNITYFNLPKMTHFNLPKIEVLQFPENEIFQSPENDIFQSSKNSKFKSSETAIVRITYFSGNIISLKQNISISREWDVPLKISQIPEKIHFHQMAGHTEESECRKIRPRKSSNMDTFHEVGMNRTTIMGARKAIFDIKYNEIACCITSINNFPSPRNDNKRIINIINLRAIK